MGHSLYLKTLLPVVGKWVTSNKAAYSYLCNSIKAFVSPNELESFLKQAGFQSTFQKPLLAGIATLIGGQK
jgi:demethylmenaquinone methyltransferase/2-methoxy-6-polyprenyl-1,4-benzoquinol methylase